MIRLLLIAVIAGTSTFGCDNDDELFNQRAELQFHNQLTQLSGGAAADVRVDLLLDGDAEPLLSDQDYSTSNTVRAVRVALDEDDQRVRLDVRGRSGSSLINGPVSKRLQDGSRYTLVLMGDTTLDNRRLESFRQVPQQLTTSQSRIRFINALSQELDDEVRVVIQGNNDGIALAEDLRFAQASSYRTVNAGSQISVEVQNQNSEEVIGQASCPLAAGQSVDAILAYRAFDSERTDIALFCQPVEE